MKILLAMSIGCLFAVLWVSFSVARSLRSKRTATIAAAARTSLQEFFEAGEYRTPRSLRLVQHAPRLPLAEITFDPGISAAAAARVRHFPSTATISLFGMKTDAEPLASQISSNAEAGVSSSPAAKPRLASVHSFPKLGVNGYKSATAPGSRKSPQPDRSAEVRRLDLSKYGEQSGDLTDPYTRNLTAVERGKWSRGI